MTIRETTDITGFHAHVYFDEATRGTAEQLREELTPRFRSSSGAGTRSPWDRTPNRCTSSPSPATSSPQSFRG